MTDIIHDRLGVRLAPPLSTSHALAAVKDDLCSYLQGHPGAGPTSILAKAHDLEARRQGHTVSFSHLTYLDRELLVTDLLSESYGRSGYIEAYLHAFFDRVILKSHFDAAARLAAHIAPGDTIVVCDYSRVLRQTFQVIAETDPGLLQSLRLFVVDRAKMPFGDDEPARMEEELRALGADPQRVSPGEWIDYLLSGSANSNIRQPVDKILFGGEAFSLSGDAVVSQMVEELDALQSRHVATEHATIIAVGESYKVCRDYREVSKMTSEQSYTVIPSRTLDLIVTDIAEYSPNGHAKITLDDCVRHLESVADTIRGWLWPPGNPLPTWNACARDMASIRVVAADVDGTITTAGKIQPSTSRLLTEVADRGVKVVLVTGRSAGWAAALAAYLPGIVGVVAENGAVLLRENGQDVVTTFLDGSLADGSAPSHDVVAAALEIARERYPSCVLGGDNAFRLTDGTVEVGPEIDPEVMAGIALSLGLRHTYSTVHHHFSRSQFSKREGLSTALSQYLAPDVSLASEVLTIGDSINDAALFDRRAFALTFGVRGVLRHLDVLREMSPEYVSLGDEGDGFCEVLRQIIGE